MNEKIASADPHPDDASSDLHDVGAKTLAWSWSLTGIMLLAIVLRLIGLSTQSLTMDECAERATAEMTVSNIIHVPNSFPPLYHLSLKGWLAIDSSEIGVRTFSLIMGLLALWSLWWIVKHVINEHVAWWALLIAACSPFHIYYSQEGRVYMLYLLLALLATGFLLRWGREGSAGHGAGFVAVAVVGGYVHYFFAIYLVTLALVATFVFGKRFLLRRLLPAAALIGVLCSPLLLLVKDDLDYQRAIREPRPLNAASVAYTYFSLASGYTLGPSRSDLHTMKQSEAARETIPWAVPLGAVIIPLLIAGCLYLRDHSTLAVWLGLLSIPFLLLAFLCVAFGVTYNTRFLVWLWIPFCVLLAAGFCRIPNRGLRVAVFGVLAVFSAIAIFNRHAVNRYLNVDVRAAAAFLRESDQRPVLVCSGYMSSVLEVYLDNGMPVVPLRSREGAESKLREYPQRPLWLLYSREYHDDPAGQILELVTGTRSPSPVFTASGVQVFACQDSRAGSPQEP